MSVVRREMLLSYIVYRGIYLMRTSLIREAERHSDVS